jgi:fructoselysine 6-kinase
MWARHIHQLRIAAFSALCADYYPQQNLVKPGGNTLNFAVQAKRIGAGNLSVAGFIGTDQNGELLLKCLNTEKIDISNVFRTEGSTASNKLYNTPDGERYSKPGEWNDGVINSGEFTEATWNFLLEHSIIAVPYLDKRMEELFRRRTENNFILMDFMHFDDYKIISDILPFIDIAFISPQPENIPAIRELARNSEKLLVTMLGAQGSRAYQHGKEFIQQAILNKKVTDTTGCGDAYQAGFICSYFIDRDIQKAMQAATIVASQVLTHYGGI